MSLDSSAVGLGKRRASMVKGRRPTITKREQERRRGTTFETLIFKISNFDTTVHNNTTVRKTRRVLSFYMRTTRGTKTPHIHTKFKLQRSLESRRRVLSNIAEAKPNLLPLFASIAEIQMMSHSFLETRHRGEPIRSTSRHQKYGFNDSVLLQGDC